MSYDVKEESLGEKLCRIHGIEDAETIKRCDEFIYSSVYPLHAYAALDKLLVRSSIGNAAVAMDKFRSELLKTAYAPLKEGKRKVQRAQAAKVRLKKRRAKKRK